MRKHKTKRAIFAVKHSNNEQPPILNPTASRLASRTAAGNAIATPVVATPPPTLREAFTAYLTSSRAAMPHTRRLTPVRRNFYIAVLKNPKIHPPVGATKQAKAVFYAQRHSALKNFCLVQDTLYYKGKVANGMMQKVVVDDAVLDLVAAAHLGGVNGSHVGYESLHDAMRVYHRITREECKWVVMRCPKCRERWAKKNVEKPQVVVWDGFIKPAMYATRESDPARPGRRSAATKALMRKEYQEEEEEVQDKDKVEEFVEPESEILCSRPHQHQQPTADPPRHSCTETRALLITAGFDIAAQQLGHRTFDKFLTVNGGDFLRAIRTLTRFGKKGYSHRRISKMVEVICNTEFVGIFKNSFDGNPMGHGNNAERVFKLEGVRRKVRQWGGVYKLIWKARKWVVGQDEKRGQMKSSRRTKV